MSAAGKILKAIIRWPLNQVVYGGTPPTLEQTLAALERQPLQLDLNPDGAWHQKLPGSVRVQNDHIGVVYLGTHQPDRYVETVDLILSGVRGGIIMTFVNTDLVVWTRNTITIKGPQISAENKAMANQVRAKVRDFLAAQGKITS